MPGYKYQATNLEGKTVRGVLRALDENDLREQLRQQSVYLIEFSEISEGKNMKKLKANETAEFCRELGAMLAAGVPLVRALNIMAQRDIKPHLKEIYVQMYRLLQQGLLLSEAMSQMGQAFPELLINMFKASESTGRMDITADRMAVHYQKSYRLQKQVRSAMTYPIILLILMVVVVFGMFIFILPTFFEVFDSLGGELPAITQAMLSLSQFMTENWMWVIIGMVVLVAVIRMLLQLPQVRLVFDRVKLKLPVIGKLLKIIYTARFARTLSSMYSSGLAIITALQNARSTIGNAYIASQFGEVVNDVRTGMSLADAVNKIDGFDKKLAATIQIGEETGKLDEMLISVSDTFDYDSDIAMQRMTTLVQPVMLIVMAVVIGVVMIAVMMPLMNLYGSMGAAGGM